MCNTVASTSMESTHRARATACLVDESCCHPRLPAAAGPTDPVHVVLDLVGHVEVDHVLDVREVQTLGGDVGGDQHVLDTLLC